MLQSWYPWQDLGKILARLASDYHVSWQAYHVFDRWVKLKKRMLSEFKKVVF